LYQIHTVIYYNVLTYNVNIIYKFLPKFLGRIAHNVPAVYDVLAARISKHEVFAGPTKCGGGFAWE
jgi:hypothetical protein